MNLGRAIKLCRSAKNLSLEVLAGRAGISTSYLSRIENHQREPALPLIGKIAEAMSVPLPVMVFLAADSDELKGMDKQTEQKFSELALELIRQS